MATQTSFLLDLAFQSTRQVESALEMKSTGTGTGLEAGTDTGLERGSESYDQMYSFFSSSISSQHSSNVLSPLHSSTAASAMGTSIRPASTNNPPLRTPPSSSSSSIQGGSVGSVHSETDGSLSYTPDREDDR